MSHILVEVNDFGDHLAVYNCIERSDRGPYLTPGEERCVSGHRALFTNHWFCCTTANDTRCSLTSSRTLLVRRQQIEKAVKGVEVGTRWSVVAVQLCFCYKNIIAGTPSALANSTTVVDSSVIHCVIFILEMLEWVIRWLIEEKCFTDRILTRTQLAACQGGMAEWYMSIHTQNKAKKKKKRPHLQGDIVTLSRICVHPLSEDVKHIRRPFCLSTVDYICDLCFFSLCALPQNP